MKTNEEKAQPLTTFLKALEDPKQRRALHELKAKLEKKERTGK